MLQITMNNAEDQINFEGKYYCSMAFGENTKY